MRIEIVEGQLLHALEYLFTQAQHRALRNIDHQAVVGVARHDAQQQDQSKTEECLRQRRILRIGGLRQRRDVVVDERTGEEGGEQRRDAAHHDADQDGEDAELIVFQHKAEEAQHDFFLLLRHMLETSLSMRAAWASSKRWLSHASPPFFASKSPESCVCMS